MNKIRQVLWNVISSGLPNSSDIEVLRKIVMLNLLALFGGIFLFLFILVAYAEKDILLTAIDSMVLVFLIILFVYLRKTGDYIRAGVLGTTAIGLFFTFQIAYGGIKQTVIIWSLTYPLIVIFLLGLKRGVRMSLLLLALSIAIFILGKNVSWLSVYQTDVIIRFIAVYLLIFFFSFSMEKVRDHVHNQLEASKSELQNALAEVQEGAEALKTLSLKDDLTSLFNRRGFFTLAEQGLKTAQRMGTEMMLIFGDLDNLKRINDTLGHSEGDQALVDLSQMLKETFRESDIIARIGGDEFVILAMNNFKLSANKLINRFEQGLNDHPLQTKRLHRLSMSFGTACFNPQNPCSTDVLLAQADKMMYENKQKRVDRV
jgi:diguanylate cyclase (GGDEF)-like protein